MSLDTFKLPNKKRGVLLKSERKKKNCLLGPEEIHLLKC